LSESVANSRAMTAVVAGGAPRGLPELPVAAAPTTVVSLSVSVVRAVMPDRSGAFRARHRQRTRNALGLRLVVVRATGLTGVDRMAI
jgi:hypothetical protein